MESFQEPDVVVSCTPFVFGSEGRTVQGVIGRNVSLSWTITDSKDSISISRNSTYLLMLWPLKNIVIWNEKDERMQVEVDNSTYEILTVTFSISSFRDNDTGIYKLERRWDPENFNDSVILQNIGLGHLLGAGLVIVAICFVIVGILIVVTQRRKLAFSKLASGTEHHQGAESSNRDVHREVLRFENHDRSLTFPIVQNNACRRIERSGYNVVNRTSRSLQTLMNHTQDFWNPVRLALSLQTLQTLTQLSYPIRSQVRSDDLISAACCSKTDSMYSIEGSENGISQDELSSRAQRDSEVSRDELNTGARSLRLNNFRPHSFEQQSEDDQYSNIDECVNTSQSDEALQEGRLSPEDQNCDYYFVIPPGH